MKALKYFAVTIITIFTFAFEISCKKIEEAPEPEKPKIDTGHVPQLIFSADQHVFTDIQTSFDGKIYLLEKGRLKQLIGNSLTDVVLPASVYENFYPVYFTLTKDLLIYLCAPTGIKAIKGNKVVKEYKVGYKPLQNFTSQNFGLFNIGFDQTDQSLIVSVPKADNPSFISYYKITDNRQALLKPDEGQTQGALFTAFNTSITTSQIYVAGLSANNNSYYSMLYTFNHEADTFNYNLTHAWGIDLTPNAPFPNEGPITNVGFKTIAAIEVANNETVYLKTGQYDPVAKTLSGTGDIYSIYKNVVKLVAENVKNKKMAVSLDGKTLYVAGNGLYKIDL